MIVLEWIRFGITAILLCIALISFASAVLGAYRFGFVMNRMHAAGIGDTLGLFCVVAATVISSDAILDALKLVLLVFFMWFTSPVSTHFLGQAEYYTNPMLSQFVRKIGKEDENGDS
ncbi:MAG: monovalent cation/H(+) antiporter subunit G [Lachnospiraceae bacterium]|nr:monovalent cation/H(+) antiporter subunit G [Lachnospiraceae bacterium]